MLRVLNCVADCVRLTGPEPTKLHRVVAVSRLIGDDTQSSSPRGLIYEVLRRGIERNFAGSELSCPPDARHQGNDHYRADEKRSDQHEEK